MPFLRMNRLFVIACGFFTGVFSLALCAAENKPSAALVDRVVDVVKQNSSEDPDKLAAWVREVDEQKNKISSLPNFGEFVAGLNAVLARYTAQPAAVYTRDDLEFWALRSMDAGKIDTAKIRQIGVWFARKGRRWYARDVFEDSPAQQAGLLEGDEIVSVNNELGHPLSSVMNGKPFAKVKVVYRRSPLEHPRELLVDTRLESVQETMLRGTKRSERIARIGGRKIGYFRLWSALHQDFLQSLARSLIRIEKDADAMILDLRDGIGGTMDRRIISQFVALGGGTDTVFRKPLVVIVNQGTSWGEEWIAKELQFQKRALVVGATTGGMNLKTRSFELIPDEVTLLLGTSRLEAGPVRDSSRPVRPDIEILTPVMYSAGQDQVLAKCMEIALECASGDRQCVGQ